MNFVPHREPLVTTLRRTVGIALAVGAVLAWRSHDIQIWPIAALLVLWVSLGGHWIEVWFLNWLRPRISNARTWQVGTRVAVWFIGGVGLGLCVALTMRMMARTRALELPPWWIGGVGFIVVELIVHAALSLVRRPNFYNGQG